METPRRWRMRGGRSAAAALPAPAGRRWRGRRPGCLKRRGRRSPRRCRRLGWRRPRRPGRVPRSHPPTGREQRGAAAAAAAAVMAARAKHGQEKAEEVCAQRGRPLSPAASAASRCAAAWSKTPSGRSCPPPRCLRPQMEAGGPQAVPGPQRGAEARGAAAPPRGVTAPGGRGCGSWCPPCAGPVPHTASGFAPAQLEGKSDTPQ